LVYYIDSTDGNVYKRRLGSGNEEKIFDLHSANNSDRLFFRPNPDNAEHWDLAARLNTPDYNSPRIVEVLTKLRVETPVDERANRDKDYRYDGSWLGPGDVPKLGDAANSPWTFWTGFYAIEGIQASNKLTGESVGFGYETPFGEWWIYNAVHLPTDKVLFQLGNDQICAFDPATRRVSLLWRGRGPAAVIEK
jgi:hypothetical protein